MIRANVGLSRKLSKDYNSTGYSVNLDGEISALVSDPEAVFEQVKELFDLAEEVLNQQIDRSSSEAAIASHDEEPRPQVPVNRNGNGTNGANGNHTNRISGNFQANTTVGVNEQKPTPPPQNGNGQEVQPATNKQIQYLLSIGKRQKLSTVQLEKKIAEIIGRPVGVYELSKMAAGIVIDALTNGASANGTKAR